MTSFYKCWPIFIIFGTRRTELMRNNHCLLPTSPTYYCYTTLENTGYSSKGLRVDAQKLMPYLCQEARALFSLISALRLMAVISATLYWCSRCCHPFVPLLVMLTYYSKTVHQRIVRDRQMVELLQPETPKFTAPELWTPNSPDLNPVDYRIWSVMRD